MNSNCGYAHIEECLGKQKEGIWSNPRQSKQGANNVSSGAADSHGGLTTVKNKKFRLLNMYFMLKCLRSEWNLA